MKYSVAANNVEHFYQLNNYDLEMIILASKYSSYRQSFNIAEIEECYKVNNNIAVSFYDLISETKVDEACGYLKQILAIGVKNFIVNDSGLVYFLRQYDVNVILDNISLNTNYESCNMWKDFGVNGVVASREITLAEINEMSEKSTIDIYIHIQGSFPIFTSIRTLLTNYYNEKKIDDKHSNLYLYDKLRDSKFVITENDSGTIMFNAYEQCSIDDLDNLVSSHFIIDQPLVSSEQNLKIVKMYLDYKNYSIDDVSSISEIKQSRGFFYKKTLYKL